jgi:branched-chain amino acid transport system substrate-binding protein
MNWARTTKVAATALSLVLMAAACGDSKSDAPSTTGARSTSGNAEGPFRVDDASCPVEARTALPAGAPIKIGVSLPQSGPLASFGALGPGMRIYLEKVNAEKGGVAGHKLELIVKDDGYDPGRTVANTIQLIEEDKIFASTLYIGTPNVQRSRKTFEDSCTPQLFVGSGAPDWGDPKNHQWTVGGILAYTTEATIWADYIAKKSPGAKVAQLVYNNDFGKTYQKTFEKAAKERGLTIVETKVHEGTATNVDNETAAILAARPDYVLGETAGSFCSQLMSALAQGGYKGRTIISSTCSSVQSFFKPIGQAGDGVLLVGAQKDPGDPQYAGDPAMVTYKADVQKFGAGANANDGSILTGYSITALLVDSLEKAAQLPGGLTRVNLMNAAWNADFSSGLATAGRRKLNGRTDAYSVETVEFTAYDAATASQHRTGDTFDYEGKTGTFQP